jgi:hypothetical protein
MPYRDQIFLLGPETTSGTAATLTGANAIPCGSFDPNVADWVEVERTQLGARPGTQRAAAITERKVSADIPFEFAGSGTRGAISALNPVMLAAGFNSSVVAGESGSVSYALAWPPSPITHTARFHRDGVLYSAAGGRVSKLVISGQAGQPLSAVASYMGLYRPPATVANPTPSYPAPLANSVPFDSSSTTPGSLTFAGVGVCVEAFELTIENTAQYYDNAGCLPRIDFTDRTVTFTLTIARLPIETLDVFTNASNSQLGALALPVGTVAGNINTFNMPQVQVMPSLVNVKDSNYIQLQGRMVAEAANQELTIVQT